MLDIMNAVIRTATLTDGQASRRAPEDTRGKPWRPEPRLRRALRLTGLN